MTKVLQSLDGLELVINEDYTARVRELEAMAKKQVRDTGNPFFRVLQLLAHLRKPGAKSSTV